MVLVTEKNLQSVFAPLVQKMLVAERHSFFRTDKQMAFAYQSYSSLQSVPDRIW